MTKLYNWLMHDIIIIIIIIIGIEISVCDKNHSLTLKNISHGDGAIR